MKTFALYPKPKTSSAIPNWLLMILISELGLLICLGLMIFFGAMNGVPIH